MLPQPPKSSSFDTLVMAGALYVLVLATGALYEVVGGAGAAGSGVLQALFEPQASMLSRPPIADTDAGFGSGAGLERLKAEAEVEVADFEGAGAPISNKSPMPELAGIGDLVGIGAGDGADVKSPKSPNPLDTRACCGLGAGAAEGLGGGVGLASKKLPPLRELLRDAGEVKFENAEGLGCCCCCCWGAVGPPKFNPPKASAMPPNEDVEAAGDCIGGEAKPPKAFEDD